MREVLSQRMEEMGKADHGPPPASLCAPLAESALDAARSSFEERGYMLLPQLLVPEAHSYAVDYYEALAKEPGSGFYRELADNSTPSATGTMRNSRVTRMPW